MYPHVTKLKCKLLLLFDSPASASAPAVPGGRAAPSLAAELVPPLLAAPVVHVVVGVTHLDNKLLSI